MATTRPATHAGSWYSANAQKLSTEINQWIGDTSVVSARFAVGPHAGYTYCGSLLGKTYSALDSNIKRVFVMSPSHYEYFKGFKTTKFKSYDTPFGAVAIDTDVTTQFHQAGVKYLSEDTDLQEHGVEMHMPFLKTVAPNAMAIPLVFGELGSSSEKLALKLLGEYFDDTDTAFVVSSDFCHWGKRFGYTHYAAEPASLLDDYRSISKTSLAGGRPIWQSIEELDMKAMEIAETGDAKAWKNYIASTGNTICGQRPFGLILSLGEQAGRPVKFKWLGYDQSSRASKIDDSSVSYASGFSI